jgi:FixJ family two-component response regulator
MLTSTQSVAYATPNADSLQDFTVFLIDDDQGTLDTLSELLREVGYSSKTYTEPTSFLEEHDVAAHGCAVLDLMMPGLNGLNVQSELKKRGIERPVIFLSGHADVATSVEAMKGGAIDFLQKPVEFDELLTAIKTAEERDRVRLRNHAECEAVAQRLAKLRPRERQVLDLVVTGMANKNIAHALAISIRTIKEHRSRICKKLETKSVPELVRMTTKLPKTGSNIANTQEAALSPKQK